MFCMFCMFCIQLRSEEEGKVRGTERMLTFSLILCSLSAHFIFDKRHLVIFVLFQSDPQATLLHAHAYTHTHTYNHSCVWTEMVNTDPVSF